MSYPTSLDSFSVKVDSVDDVMAADVNGLQTAVVAVETALGTGIAGSQADLKTRLAKSLTTGGLLAMPAATLLTIAGGSITPTLNFHRVDTEGGASTDELTAIAAGTDGQFLFIRPVDTSRKITIVGGSSIALYGGQASFDLNHKEDLALLVYDGNLGKWLCECFMGIATENSWDAPQHFSSISTSLQTFSANTTLDGTMQLVMVTASGGAITIALPPAISCIGRRYDIKKIDSSANAVTVDGNGSETIDGALTKALSTQYESVTVISSGVGWYVIG